MRGVRKEAHSFTFDWLPTYSYLAINLHTVACYFNVTCVGTYTKNNLAVKTSQLTNEISIIILLFILFTRYCLTDVLPNILRGLPTILVRRVPTRIKHHAGSLLNLFSYTYA